jgi:hypothetical protein
LRAIKITLSGCRIPLKLVLPETKEEEGSEILIGLGIKNE